ncbi:MAG: hypothetical protein R2939_10485 [Kofleriaceae bacterium]
MPTTLAAVDAFARSLPEVTLGTRWGNLTYLHGKDAFAWQRPFSKADLRRFGDEAPPAGDIVAVRVADLDAKDAVLGIAPPGFFTIPHFDGFAAVLIALRSARVADVRAALRDAHAAVGGRRRAR